MSQDFFYYTFLDGRLIGSEHPAATGEPSQVIRRMMAQCRASVLITLTPLFRDYKVAGLLQHHLPLSEIPSREQVVDAVKLVRQQLNEGQVVWVHCQQGIDRTGCVIGAYLVAAGQAPTSVLAELFQRFPSARRQTRMAELWAPFRELVCSFAESH
jgi:hypothetical protein